MCNTSNIKALELYCNIKKWNIELDTLVINLLSTEVNRRCCSKTEGRKGNIIYASPIVAWAHRPQLSSLIPVPPYAIHPCLGKRYS